MVRSSFTLYMHTHLVAASIFAALMIAASTAVAVVRHTEAKVSETRGTGQYMGRFVVTPSGARFEAEPITQTSASSTQP